MERFSRTELVIGHEAMEKLNKASVAVFGIGGVGSYAAEALARSGVGRLMLVDDDVIAESNINPPAYSSYLYGGQAKGHCNEGQSKGYQSPYSDRRKTCAL